MNFVVKFKSENTVKEKLNKKYFGGFFFTWRKY